MPQEEVMDEGWGLSLEHFAFEIVPFQKRRCRHFA